MLRSDHMLLHRKRVLMLLGQQRNPATLKNEPAGEVADRLRGYPYPIARVRGGKTPAASFGKHLKTVVGDAFPSDGDVAPDLLSGVRKRGDLRGDRGGCAPHRQRTSVSRAQARGAERPRGSFT
jgi:hypothetical protein